MNRGFDYEPCPACGGKRWRGLKLPVCDGCIARHVSAEWQRLYHKLNLGNASVEVMRPVNAALVADVRELIESDAHHRPFRTHPAA